MSIGTAILVSLVLAGLVVAWTACLLRLRRLFGRDACPSCRGVGSLRTEYGFSIGCSDCRGTGSVLAGLPDTVPASWTTWR